MKFSVVSKNILPLQFMRQLGYHPHKENGSFEHRLSRNKFPRFHVYLKSLEDKWEISLHLDQKSACHEGQSAHSGEYDGELLQEEKERIIKALKINI